VRRGGGGDASSSAAVIPGPAPAAATILTGSVVDGFIAGATVQAYQLNANGSRGALIGASATTDASGNYTLNLGTYTGPVLVEASAGASGIGPRGPP